MEENCRFDIIVAVSDSVVASMAETAEEELLVLAHQEGKEDLVREFPKLQREILLEQYGVSGALRKMEGAQSMLEELRRMEQMADREKLLDEFESGRVVVQGFDRHGRPVLWGRHPKNARSLTKPYTEALLYEIWVLVWSFQVRSSNDIGVNTMFSEFDRKLLEFNLSYQKEEMRIINRLIPAPHPDSVLNVFLPNRLLATFANLVIQSLSSQNASTVVQFHYHLEDAFDLLAEPQTYPGTFHHGGKPFSCSFDQVGNWRDLVDGKCGFANLTLSDFLSPNPERIAYLRKLATDKSVASSALFSQALTDETDTESPTPGVNTPISCTGETLM